MQPHARPLVLVIKALLKHAELNKARLTPSPPPSYAGPACLSFTAVGNGVRRSSGTAASQHGS